MVRIKKKVIIALSGGIDSSVAAALLKRAGFEVAGIFMRFWMDPLAKRRNRCCSPESEKRAKLVAASLNLPFYVLNFEKEFKKKIVDYFLKEHQTGLTPNPCVVCNKEIKFGLLLEKALALRADYVATGHYVKKQETRLQPTHRIPPQSGPLRKQKTEYKLLMAKDKKKDQSYFLWMLNQEQLRRILFPVGDYTKNQVKDLAKKFDLPVFDIPESQEICFIETTINDFLKKHLKSANSGKIIDSEGKILGSHLGSSFYTIGQRKGIGLPGGPYYVLDKNLKKNLLVVTKNEKDLLKKELIAGNVNWVSGRRPELPLRVKTKIRYRQEATPAVIKKQKTPNKSPWDYTGQAENKKQDLILVEFKKPQRAITPGQSVVFYRGEELIGGGVIRT